MDPTTRTLKCQICYDFASPRTELDLQSLRKGCSQGCIRCNLMSTSASLFRDRWSHLEEGEDASVSLVATRPWSQHSLVLTNLQWPGITGGQEDLAIQIMTEDEHTEVWSLFTRARSVPLTSASSKCIHFIHSKLADCNMAHENCNRLGAKTQRPKRLLRIVETDDLRLVLLDTIEANYKFIALSHCWGTSQNANGEEPVLPKMTTKGNLESHQLCGFLVADLTRTFQHAIDLTRKLGIDYIWIDSLCIIQDDDQDKAQEIPKMGDVYGGADLVIAATLAENGGYGLYHDRRSSRIKVPISKDKSLRAIVFEKRHHDVWKMGEQFWIAPELPLLNRAWAFQERLLAKRIVHFTPNEVIWECRSSVDCECGDLQNPQLSWVEFGVGKNFKSKYAEVVRCGSDIERLNFWHDICAQYSARKITKATDRLPALSSIAKEINMPPFLGRYLAGIWECTLPGGLLWWSEHTNPVLYPERTATHQRARDSCAPSWSWLSIDGRVSTWGRCVMPLVHILNLQYVPRHGDEYGPCSDSEISVLGTTVPVEVIRASPSNGLRETKVRLPASNELFDFITDTRPFELSHEHLESSTLLALRFALGGGSYIQAIILRRVSGSTDRFQRLGIAECPSKWFDR